MNRKYNFRQSQELLQVDPKTFGRWLEKAHIDPSKQINRADPRQKWLTEEQLRMLAREHGRELPSPDQEDEPEPRPAVILTTVDERLFALEQLLTHRFDQLDARLEQLLAQLQRARVSPTTGTPIRSSPRTRIAAPSTPTTVPPKPTAKKRGKRTAKAKQLPKNLVPLSAFKSEHNVSDKAVEYAMERGKLTIERGKWRYNGRNVMIALGQQGRQQFYTLFSEREGFQRCKDCPHTL